MNPEWWCAVSSNITHADAAKYLRAHLGPGPYTDRERGLALALAHAWDEVGIVKAVVYAQAASIEVLERRLRRRIEATVLFVMWGLLTVMLGLAILWAGCMPAGAQ